MSDNMQYCPECGTANEVGTSFCGECGTKLDVVETTSVESNENTVEKNQVLENEVNDVNEANKDNIGETKKFNLKIIMLIVCVLIVAIIGFTAITKLGGSTDYTAEIYTYHNDDGETFVWVDGESIQVDDETVYFDLYNSQNFPMKDYINTQNIDSYLSEDLIVLESNSNGIYVINVKKEEVEKFERGVSFQVSDDKKEILILEFKDYEYSGDLILVEVKSLDDEDVIDDVMSFTASEDFKKIFVQLEDELLLVDTKGDEKEEISDEEGRIIALVDDYLFFMEDNDYIVYNTKKLEKMESYDDLSASSIKIIDGDIYFIAEENLYMIDGKKVEKIDKDVVQLNKDNGNYHFNGGDVKEAKKTQVIMYMNDDGDRFIYNGKKFIESEIDDDADIFGDLTDQTKVFKDGKKVMYYNEKNDWEGDELDLDDEASYIYGHTVKNFIYTDDDMKVYHSNGKDADKLSFDSDEIYDVTRFNDGDYVAILEDKLVFISSKGKEKEVDVDDDIYGVYEMLDEDLIFILTEDDELFVYEAGDKKVKLVSKDVDDVAVANSTLMYITDDELMIYKKGKSKSVAEDIDSVSNIND